MPSITEQMLLKECDGDDISDVIQKLEKSFGLRFHKDAFLKVTTFGEFCDVFQEYISSTHEDTCTTQQAFYKLRDSISILQQIDKMQIQPDSQLTGLLPKKDRRKKVRRLIRDLGIRIRVLENEGWIHTVWVSSFIGSLVYLFFDWKIGLTGLISLIVVEKILRRLAMQFRVKTLAQLSELLTKQSYISMRSRHGTVNRNEVTQIIVDTFAEDLLIDKSLLAREEKFS
jgi:hypothetical protein